MNDVAVREIWESLRSHHERLKILEAKVEFLRGQVKARLKEEADARKERLRGIDREEWEKFQKERGFS